MTQTSPSNIGHFEMPISKATENFKINVTITGLRSWRARCWIGCRLIVLGAWVTGMDCEVDFKAPE